VKSKPAAIGPLQQVVHSSSQSLPVRMHGVEHKALYTPKEKPSLLQRVGRLHEVELQALDTSMRKKPSLQPQACHQQQCGQLATDEGCQPWWVALTPRLPLLRRPAGAALLTTARRWAAHPSMGILGVSP